MSTSLYSRVLIPDLTSIESNKFPGEAVAMGGNILPLEEQFHPGKSLRFHKGIFQVGSYPFTNKYVV